MGVAQARDHEIPEWVDWLIFLPLSLIGATGLVRTAPSALCGHDAERTCAWALAAGFVAVLVWNVACTALVRLSMTEHLPAQLRSLARSSVLLAGTDRARGRLAAHATACAVVVGVTTGLAPGTHTDVPGDPTWAGVSSTSGAPRPDADAAQPARPPPTEVAPQGPREPVADGTIHVVQTGDCLWTITAGLVTEKTGTLPDDSAIARTWPRLYAANADRLGPDPDLIHPGVALVVPPDLLPPASPDDQLPPDAREDT